MIRTRGDKKKERFYIAFDNGVSGTIGIINSHGNSNFLKTPSYSEQSFTKKKQKISRIKHNEIYDMLSLFHGSSVMIGLENPMENSRRFKASISGARAVESTLIAIERLDLPYQYIYSKDWQKVMLPKGTKGKDECKKASMQIACRLFPQHRELIEKHKDGDGLLMAEYLRRGYPK